MKAEDRYTRMRPVELTLNGLTRALLEEINAIRQGKTTLAKARAINGLAKRIVEVQIIQMQMIGDIPVIKTIEAVKDDVVG
jgi:hypothetical protein